MTHIVLSTGNIVSAGPSIIRKPGTYRSNLELTNSLRDNFEAAQADYGTNNGNSAHAQGNGQQTNGVNGSANGSATSSWTETEDAVLYVPRIDWAGAGLEEDRDQYEVTVKLFFLPDPIPEAREEHIDEALRLVFRELGIQNVDLLIASFPGLSFEGDCEWEADKMNATMGSDEEEVFTWATLERLQTTGVVGRLGIAEFGTAKLQRFIDKVNIKPAVDQINLKDCCSVPMPLVRLAKSEGVELLTHSDSTAILPSSTLQELLGDDIVGNQEVVPSWVAKYTAFVKNRGVIENKGYFAGAQLIPTD
ncbi:glutamate-cysteine ligase modifier subunit [Xylariaceae sp. FL1019]|nr:glutamate-cysteine ligase modifier subunit [Xylariaceae sp. FL1019]